MLSTVDINSFGEYFTAYNAKKAIILTTNLVVLLDDNRWNSKKKICLRYGVKASLKIFHTYIFNKIQN